MLIFSTTAFAEVSRDEAKGIIDEMVSKQMISAQEAEKAKARLINLGAGEWASLNSYAEEKVGRMPASVESSSPTDLSDEQFQAIQNDLAVIAPHYISGK
jgi:hypothetical protein